MPRLTQRMHRFACRTGFVVLCIVPTLGVTGGIIRAHLPSQRAAWEAQLSARMEANVTIGQIAFPQPGLTRIERLTIAEPGCDQPLITVDRLQFHKAGHIWLAEAHLVQISPGKRGLWPLMRRCAASVPGHADDPVQLTAERVTVSGAAAEQRLKHFTCRLDPSQSRQLTLRAMPGDYDSPIQVDLKTQPDGTCEAQLDTGTTPLTSGLLACLLPDASRLGSLASIQGTLSCTLGPAGASGLFSGQLSGLNLSAMTTGAIPPDLVIEGTGQLTLTEARFRDGRIEHARGSLRCTAGKAGPGVIAGAIEALKLRTDEPPSLTRSAVAFQELSLDFSIDAQQVKLAGRCVHAPAGTLMTSDDGNRVLLSTAGVEPQPPTALVRMFSSPSLDWVPATPEAQWLLERLPRANASHTASRTQ